MPNSEHVVIHSKMCILQYTPSKPDHENDHNKKPEYSFNRQNQAEVIDLYMMEWLCDCHIENS